MSRNSIETFPSRMRELREAKGLSRDQLAVAAGTSSHSISKLEQGVRAPSLELAWRVAKALGCTLDDMVQPPLSASEQPRGRGRPPRAGAAAPSVPPVEDLEQQAVVGPKAKKRPGQPQAAPADFEIGAKKRTRRKKGD